MEWLQDNAASIILSIIFQSVTLFFVWKRIPAQNLKDNSEAGVHALEMAETATKIAKEARGDLDKVLKAVGGKATISGWFQVEDLIKNGEAQLIDGKVTLQKDISVKSNDRLQ